MKSLRDIASDMHYILFPQLCILCDDALPARGHDLCVSCLHHVAYTDHFRNVDNNLVLHLAGRIPFERGAALLNMRKSGAVHDLLRRIKYHRQWSAAVALGKLYGEQMIQYQWIEDIDVIVPVPLHWRKLRKRGFNQSEKFAVGIQAVTGIAINTDVLIKNKYAESQTGMSRAQRVRNVSEGIMLTQMDQIAGKHILLVDDIITTGATLESCVLELSKAEDVRFSIATMAITMG